VDKAKHRRVPGTKIRKDGENENKGEKIMTLESTVKKWGNSLAIRIPSVIAEQIEITQGSTMELTVLDNQELQLAKKKRKPTLQELLSQCKSENRHEEIDLGIARRWGYEVPLPDGLVFDGVVLTDQVKNLD
jgi:antitoxin MazE